MDHLPRGAAAALLGLSLSLLGTGVAQAAPPAPTAVSSVAETARVRLELPPPTGAYAVGRDTLHLVDGSRPDHWVPEAGARELMVSMYYPARPGGGRTAPYMTAAEAQAFIDDRRLTDVVSARTLSGTRTNARPGAAPVRGKFPLVVLSPGFTVNRSTLTLLAEELASRGYVVASVDHAYESVGTAFPGGRLLNCVACEKTSSSGYDEVPRGRAEDVSFLLDRLLADRHAAWRHARMIDPTRIGMAGHSVGGASAATAMAGDQRVRAGANMDGSFMEPVPAQGLGGRPFMLLGTDDGDRSWTRDWPLLDGWKRWIGVTGAEHFTFTDVPVLGDQLGLLPPEEPLSGKRSQEITRAYVTAFFDLHLKGVDRKLLDGPTAEHPEVVFRTEG
ncbi:alpha/beta hydrolase [Streptomyces sp. Tu 3180]|uniref:alpha/beta hydrolase family protein n=1 Tax=Streptomyces sp. Tu 3180 TaxID=2682611 RepID=UPI00135C5A63|nr:alpha/beta hydrolase [Streptomyces sp. Tu 3180]KAF3463569.1 alpha/beta hydrolase [Streptomyces sp. Tu 3180]